MSSTLTIGTAQPKNSLQNVLTLAELSAARFMVWRILEETPAELLEAALFGSKARGEAGPDSDVDILLVFRYLPPDREPQATIAERIAEEVAGDTGIPLTVWSVSLPDLRPGERTPMLVDALADAIPLWCWPDALSPVCFLPTDALNCSRALLARVAEGSVEFAQRMRQGDAEAAARRARDDLVRLGTALLLLRGITRPRRSEVVDELFATEFSANMPPAHVRLVLDWVRLSFGPTGKETERVTVAPPGGLPAVSWAVDYLRARVVRAARQLEREAESEGTPAAAVAYS